MSNSDKIVDEENELNSVAMQIILHAGNARALADEAFKLAKEEDFKAAYEKINEANSNGILKAHRSQTRIIQDEARGIKHEPSLLFNHAQDHLMTIMSEIRLMKQIIELYELTVSKR
ncbi:PTS lactose/cellobiose transporter subunit IIA [Amphibacillus sp. Q70]|uniref:PTS lactose/cellobiose transporter subunit IIA n=1 Tax=Amphibacillus sp. Q70 TaxID=3453416 RepID=UPI003F832F3C